MIILFAFSPSLAMLGQHYSCRHCRSHRLGRPCSPLFIKWRRRAFMVLSTFLLGRKTWGGSDGAATGEGWLNELSVLQLEPGRPKARSENWRRLLTKRGTGERTGILLLRSMYFNIHSSGAEKLRHGLCTIGKHDFTNQDGILFSYCWSSSDNWHAKLQTPTIRSRLHLGFTVESSHNDGHLRSIRRVHVLIPPAISHRMIIVIGWKHDTI